MFPSDGSYENHERIRESEGDTMCPSGRLWGKGVPIFFVGRRLVRKTLGFKTADHVSQASATKKNEK